MNALLFPGQGSQLIGMGSEFYNKFEKVKKIFKEADEKLKFSISKIILEGPEDKLQMTENTQPAILLVSYSIFTILRQEFNIDHKSFKYFAGHSLGEYSALVCSHSLLFDDALYLLNERGKAMQEAVPVGKGGMIAVLGLKTEEITNVIEKINGNKICEIANDNANGQVIVSGEKDVIENLQKELKSQKIKTIPLKVSAPFHCSLMRPAAQKMTQKINDTNFKKPSIDIISNVTAKAESDSSKIKDLLIEQIFSTVRWRESLEFMFNNGVKNFVEIGPGKALTGMVKRTLKNSNSFSINSTDDMKLIQNEFKK